MYRDPKVERAPQEETMNAKTTAFDKEANQKQIVEAIETFDGFI